MASARRPRILYVSGGGADIIGAHRHWRSGVDDPSQVSVTFSSQVAEFIGDIDGESLLVSFRDEPAELDDGRFQLRHLVGRQRGGAGYHLEGVRRTRLVGRLAREFGAEVILTDSGALPYFALPLLRRGKAAVVPVLHNSLWPAGNPPRAAIARSIRQLDGLFWRTGNDPVLAVSPECARQAVQMRGARRSPPLVFSPLFKRGNFAVIPPCPPADRAPFTVMFVGRAIKEKGLLLLADIADLVQRAMPHGVRWLVCGDGPDLEQFRQTVSDRGLAHVIDIRGWVAPEELRRTYAEVHAVIVPTTSRFTEGLAMTAVEAVLAGRPLVTNPVVPALELLDGAAVAARPDDAQSHAAAIISLASDRVLFERKRHACAAAGERFYDDRNSLRSTLMRAWQAVRPAA